MRFRSQRHHIIDLLFPIALFFVFALSALTVILLATNSYQETTAATTKSYTERTALSYVAEKVRQTNGVGEVTLGTFDGCDSLILSQTVEGERYHTYIYYDQDTLKEILLKDQVEATAADGTEIVKAHDFAFEQVTPKLISFTITDQDGASSSIVMEGRSL